MSSAQRAIQAASTLELCAAYADGLTRPDSEQKDHALGLIAIELSKRNRAAFQRWYHSGVDSPLSFFDSPDSAPLNAFGRGRIVNQL